MYTMMQDCRELDMTYQTLKYYCNEGLIPHVKRDGNNCRICDKKDVKWIKNLTCLKIRTKCLLVTYSQTPEIIAVGNGCVFRWNAEKFMFDM